MIYGNLHTCGEYAFLPEAIQSCFAFAMAPGFSRLSTGRHTLEGTTLYVNISEYTTAPEESRPWEAYRQYLDLHLVLQGEELAALNHIGNMELGEFQPARDFLPMQGSAECTLRLRPGDFLICFPGDAHKTGTCVGTPTHIKKAVFKIRIP